MVDTKKEENYSSFFCCKNLEHLLLVLLLPVKNISPKIVGLPGVICKSLPLVRLVYNCIFFNNQITPLANFLPVKEAL